MQRLVTTTHAHIFSIRTSRFGWFSGYSWLAVGFGKRITWIETRKHGCLPPPPPTPSTAPKPSTAASKCHHRRSANHSPIYQLHSVHMCFTIEIKYKKQIET
jgi:hypothetical protein